MAISRRQRNIINPYAEDDFTYPNGYNETRNSWVIKGIHNIYLNFGEFPLNGTEVLPRGTLTGSTTLSNNDLQAYSFLYPQNAQVVNIDGVIQLEEPSLGRSKEVLEASNRLISKLARK